MSSRSKSGKAYRADLIKAKVLEHAQARADAATCKPWTPPEDKPLVGVKKTTEYLPDDENDCHVGDKDPVQRPESSYVNDPSKQSCYLPAETLDEMKAQAKRLDRSLSWIVQQAFKIARREIRTTPSHADLIETATESVVGTVVQPGKTAA